MVFSELTQGEQAILKAFANDLRGGGSGTLKLSALLGDGGKREDLRKAIWSLADRGWLVVGSTLHWGGDNQCVLLGEGLRRARAMLIGEVEGHSPSEAGDRSELERSSE